MPMRPCLDCRRPTEGSRCGRCKGERERGRGSRQERGYDADYEQQLRDPAYVAATHCTSCGEAFTDDNPKTGGHVTALRHGGGDGSVVAQCQRCNYGWSRTGT